MGGQGFHGGFVGHATRLGATLLVANLVSLAQRAFSNLIDLGNQRLILGVWRPVPHRVTRFFDEFMNGLNGNIALLVTKHDGTEHEFFTQLQRF